MNIRNKLKAKEICGKLLPHTTSRYNNDMIEHALNEAYERGYKRYREDDTDLAGNMETVD